MDETESTKKRLATEKIFLPEMERKRVEVSGQEYVLIKIPAVQGRKFLVEYPKAFAMDSYEKNQAITLELMHYVAIEHGGMEVPLDSEALVNSWVKDAESLIKLEGLVFEFNYGFFERGVVLSFWKELEKTLNKKTIAILTLLFRRLSSMAGPLSKS